MPHGGAGRRIDPEIHPTPAPRGANDFAVFFTQALSSLFSGMIVTSAGWERVNLAALPLVLLVAVAILWLAAKQRSAVAAAS